MVSKRALASMMAVMVLCTGALIFCEHSSAEADETGDGEQEWYEGLTEDDTQNITIIDNKSIVVGSLAVLAFLLVSILFLAREVMS